MKLIEISSPIPNSRAYFLDECSVIISQDEYKIRGIFVKRWHLSIAHSNRYPNWEEIKEARYRLLPDEVTMAILLPPKDQYVNVHKNCFHLHEIKQEDKE
jgi:hypothetical protein